VANLKSISHRCHPILVAFVWELTKETIELPLGCLQVGLLTCARPSACRSSSCRQEACHIKQRNRFHAHFPRRLLQRTCSHSCGRNSGASADVAVVATTSQLPHRPRTTAPFWAPARAWARRSPFTIGSQCENGLGAAPFRQGILQEVRNPELRRVLPRKGTASGLGPTSANGHTELCPNARTRPSPAVPVARFKPNKDAKALDGEVRAPSVLRSSVSMEVFAPYDHKGLILDIRGGGDRFARLHVGVPHKELRRGGRAPGGHPSDLFEHGGQPPRAWRPARLPQKRDSLDKACWWCVDDAVTRIVTL